MNQTKKCEAEYYGKCGGQLHDHDVVYHCRPRSKDLTRGHEPFDQTKQVVLCEGHYKRISQDYEGKLPELYGWDFEDALDGLTCRLHYTGVPERVFCVDCTFPVKATITETGLCTNTCSIMQTLKRDDDWKWECMCHKPVECICASFNNNALHWAILTYVNGFNSAYYCMACIHPSWRDSYEEYKSGLYNIELIIAMAQTSPELLVEKNANGKTPLDLIPEMIESLEYTLDDEYLKYAESCRARSNINDLNKIKKELETLLL